MSTAAVPALPPRPVRRTKLRTGVFINPATGERLNRAFTLRQPLPESLGAAGGASNQDEYEDFWDDELTATEKLEALGHNCCITIVRAWQWLHTDAGHGLLKCTIAYALGSLFTFYGPLARLLGPRDGKHITATITVYFHPARSFGSMLEAIMISVVAVAYATLVCTVSMAVAVVLGGRLEMHWLSNIIVLVVFIGGGLGFACWVKQRLNHPLVNVSCTLASMSIVSALTKDNVIREGVFDGGKIFQIFLMLIFGISCTVAVNLLLWRVSARRIMRENMTKASTTLGNMLSIITIGFLTGSREELDGAAFKSYAKAWNDIDSKLNKTVREAKFEHFLVGHEYVYPLEKAVFKSLEGLAHVIGGLRSAAQTQFMLMDETEAAWDGRPVGLPAPGSASPVSQRQKTFASVVRKQSSRNTLSVIDESPMEALSEVPTEYLDQEQQDAILAASRTLRTPSDIVDLFVSLLGPSMKSMVYTLSEILRDPPFGAAPKYNNISINAHYRQSLVDAIELFVASRSAALSQLYKSIELDRSRSDKIKADFEEVAAACGHFSFTLQALGDELCRYLNTLEELGEAMRENNKRSWKWLRFWDQFALVQLRSDLRDAATEAETAPLLNQRIRKGAMPKGIPDQLRNRRDTFAWDAAPRSSKVARSLSQRVLQSIRVMARDDVRFGIKVGIGAILWASLAFIPQTQAMYMHWRGEWGLLSFMIVCAMTVGASNTTSYSRFIGTMVGALCAVVNWTLTSGAPVPLFVLGWMVSVAAFYVILVLEQGPMGRITLLAYNVTTLYAYSLSLKVHPGDDDDEDDGKRPLVLEIAKHRVTAVLAGMLWGLLICRVIWPISARQKFKQGLSVLFLQMGLIWKRGPLATLLQADRNSSAIYLSEREKILLQRYLSRLDGLRSSATAEISLRGPFPNAIMGRIVASTQRILDAFQAMNVVEQRRVLSQPGSHRLSQGETALLALTVDDRKLLCDRICHVFQVVASSLMLEYPLADAMPSIVGARDQLLGKIYMARKECAAMTMAATGRSGSGGSNRSLSGDLVSESSGSRQPPSPKHPSPSPKNSNAKNAGNLTSTPANIAYSNLSPTASPSRALPRRVMTLPSPSLSPSFSPPPPPPPPLPPSPSVASGSVAPSLRTASSSASLGPNRTIQPGTVIEERDYALLYAYILVTNQVAFELQQVQCEVEKLYGLLNERDMLLQWQ